MTVRQIDDLLAQAESPLQRVILLAQLHLLRQQERKRQAGQISAEMLLTFGLILILFSAVGILSLIIIQHNHAAMTSLLGY